MIGALYEFGKLKAGETPEIPLEKIDEIGRASCRERV